MAGRVCPLSYRFGADGHINDMMVLQKPNRSKKLAPGLAPVAPQWQEALMSIAARAFRSDNLA